MKKYNYIILPVFATILFSCQDKVEHTRSASDNSSYTFYEDLPHGCDSAKVVDYLDPAFDNFTNIEYPEFDSPTSMIFYYEGGKKALIRSYGDRTYARVLYANEKYSEELLVERIMTRSGFTYKFTISDKVLFETSPNTDQTTRADLSYLACVDAVSDEMADGSKGTVSRLLTKICSACSVAAAAVICIF